MENFKMEVKEKKTYRQRVISGGIFYWILFFVGNIIEGIAIKEFPLLIFIIFGSVLGFMSYIEIKKAIYFITLFEIKDGWLHLEYSEKYEKKVIEGQMKDFVFKEKNGPIRFDSYIEIYNRAKGKILWQANAHGWADPLIKLKKYLEERKLLK